MQVVTGLSVRVRGQVQGVGFRPFVWQLARRFGVRGMVLNDPEGVLIRAGGGDLPGFVAALTADAPPLSRVDQVEATALDFEVPEGFEIVLSRGVGAETRVTPDAAICADCAAEMTDSTDRRFGYPFLNCTHCGPRFSILNGLPYDRARTTMAEFKLCEACADEYGDPGDRRFHAQPVACPDCGPRLWVEPKTAGDPVLAAVEALRRGGVVAVKGLGGFHLAVDACNPRALMDLRKRKQRPGKPLAMMGDLEMIRRFASLSEAEEALLCDPAAPVVLLGKGPESLPDPVAPGQDRHGWMLPYTPLHVLLIRAFRGPLVMTSGNLSGEPQVIGNAEARTKLDQFADLFLMHNRDIARRLDDSVEQMTPAGPMVLRRARGRVPGTLPLPPGFEDTPQVIGYGGQMKGAMCLLKNGQALLGHHMGDLDDALSWDAFLEADQDYAGLFDHQPEVVAVDMHPDFQASRHGAVRAARDGLALVEVQHHHGHLAACLGENKWPLNGGRVAGIVLDGLGLGPDGTVWGGEVLLADYTTYERRAWLKPAALIGGDRAQTDPWRNALARLDQAGLSGWADQLFPDAPRDIVRLAAARGLNAPLSSSAGRLFDAVAAVAGVCPVVQSYEGEAAMRLEALARDPGQDGFEFGFDGNVIDPGPLFHALRAAIDAGVSPEQVSGGFHRGLARAFAEPAMALVRRGEAQAVALTGGCFQNVLLLQETLRCLGNVPVLIHTKTPANDGGLAFGQALIAAACQIDTRC